MKRTGGMAEVVEHLPSKSKASSSIPSTAKRSTKEKAIYVVFNSHIMGCMVSYYSEI
jgi:hypothetical protein